MAEVGVFVVEIIVFVVVVVLVLIIAVLFIGVVVDAVVVGILTTRGWLFNVVIVTIPAMHVITNIMNQMMILWLSLFQLQIHCLTYPLLRPNNRMSSINGLPCR